MPSISSSNAVYLLSIPSLYPVPQQLQGFSADEIFATDPLESAEAIMGLDGIASYGFRYVFVKQTISLQADSASNVVFDTWWSSTQQIKDVFLASGSITLPSVGLKYSLTNGALTTYQPISDAGTTLKPRKFGITWQRVIPAVLTGVA